MGNNLKFRVWDNYGSNFLFGEDDEQPNMFFNGGVPYNLSEILSKKERFMLQQFTGLTDKNGKEIYEGDIVQLGWDTSDVHWSSLKAKVVWWHNGFYCEVNGGSLAQDNYYQFKYCEVIGNIFENPELLK